MALKDRTQYIKSMAADIYVSLSDKILCLPMKWVAKQAGEAKINKQFHKMTINGFLLEVCRSEGNIPKPYCIAVEELASILESNGEIIISEANACYNQKEAVKSKAVLGNNGEAPLFERILETINGVIYYMKNGGRKGNERQAAVIDHFCNTSGNYEVTATTFGCTRQNVEIAVKRFNRLLLEGKAWSGLEELYTIDPQLLKSIHEVANTLPGRLRGGLNSVIGTVEETPLDYILRMLECEVATFGNIEFVIKRGKIQSYTQIADTARRALSKSVEAIPFYKLSEGLSSEEASFLMRYLSITKGIKFMEDNNVIMTGNGLEKAVRQARIISEADGWISKEDIFARYEAEYDEPMGTFATTALHKLGCTNHNKLGYWAYNSEKVGKVKDVIHTILNSETPIATYRSIVKAVRANGLLYPEDTIRACITDLACPENSNHELFCLKGYTHLFPSLSWRSYKKQPV